MPSADRPRSLRATQPAHHPAQRSKVWAHVAAIAVTTLVWTAASTAVGQAQSAMPAGSPGRFTMHPTDGGVLRLDTQTGSLSMCKQVAGSWACTMLPDDRTALSDELEKLRAENTELKASVKRLEDLVGAPSAEAGSGDAKPHAGLQLPSEQDVDKAMGYVERMLKKFKDKLKELEGSDGQKL